MLLTHSEDFNSFHKYFYAPGFVLKPVKTIATNLGSILSLIMFRIFDIAQFT